MGIINYGLLSQIGSPAQIASFQRSTERPQDIALKREEMARQSNESAMDRDLQRELTDTGIAASERKGALAQEAGFNKFAREANEARRVSDLDRKGNVGLEQEKQAGRLELARDKDSRMSPFQEGQLGLRAGELGLAQAKFGQGQLNREQDIERKKPLDQVKMNQAVADLNRTFLGNDKMLMDMDKAKRAEVGATAEALATVTATMNSMPKAMRPKYWSDNIKIIQRLDPNAPDEYTEEQHAAYNIAGKAFHKEVKDNPLLAVDIYSKAGQALTERALLAQLPAEEQLDVMDKFGGNEQLQKAPQKEKPKADPNEGRVVVNKATGERFVIRNGKPVPIKEGV